MKDPWGYEIIRPETEGMFYPVQHVRCGHIHDAGLVEITGRWADCTQWACPGCGGTCDDRPLGWGGNIRKLGRDADGRNE